MSEIHSKRSLGQMKPGRDSLGAGRKEWRNKKYNLCSTTTAPHSA
jgi:hypothetical protein